MTKISDIIIPRDNPNDEEVIITEILTQSGSFVETDDEILSYETSKGSYTLMSNATGYILFNFEEGETIKIADKVASIFSDKEEIANTSFTKDTKENRLTLKEKKRIKDMSNDSTIPFKDINPNTYSSFAVGLFNSKLIKNTKSFISLKNISITDYITYCACRLLTSNKSLNSKLRDEKIIQNEEVNVDYILKIKMYPTKTSQITNIEKMSIYDFSLAHKENILRYIRKEPLKKSQNLSAVTISNLYDYNIKTFLPRIQNGQCATIGIASSNQNNDFEIIINFDSRITNAQDVAVYLNELRNILYS